MDFGDVASGKLHDNGFTLVGLIGRDEHIHASRFGLRECVGQIRHLISHNLPAVGVGKVPVGRQHGQLAEL